MFDLRTFAILFGSYYSEIDPTTLSFSEKQMVMSARNLASQAFSRQTHKDDGLPWVPTVLPDDRFKAAFNRLCSVMEGNPPVKQGLIR